MPFPYEVVLVIGATSGIGLALTEKMLSEGVTKTIALGRRQDKLNDLQKKHGESKVSTVQFDITNLRGIPEMINGHVTSIAIVPLQLQVLKAHPTLDCAFLNSGIQRSLDFTKPESIDLDLISTEFTTNYLSYGGDNAGLVFTTSGLALVPITRCGNYCASKAAMHQLILVMREQLRVEGGGADTEEEATWGKWVKVIEIYPPAVQTELHDEKHQPDIKNGRSFGMPLEEFTDEAWKGLERGDEDIPVGITLTGFGYEGVEMSRKELFGKVMDKTKGK